MTSIWCHRNDGKGNHPQMANYNSVRYIEYIQYLIVFELPSQSNYTYTGRWLYFFLISPLILSDVRMSMCIYIYYAFIDIICILHITHTHPYGDYVLCNYMIDSNGMSFFFLNLHQIVKHSNLRSAKHGGF